MDALEFLREHKRMCSSYEIRDVTSDEDCKKIIAVVDQWSKKHPRKTRQDVFLEQWPKAYVKYGMPTIRPCDLYAKYRKANGDCARHGINCAQCCCEFWGQEVE